MSRRTLLGAVATIGLAATLLPAPALAQAPAEFPITVSPDSAHPTESFTVTGDATDPTCSEDGVAVSLNYTKPDGSTGHVTVNATTDTAGHFSVQLTVPENAYAGEPANVRALIADCTPPDSASVGARSSESEPFEVLAYKGPWKLSKYSGRPGEKITFSGTNCWGGTVATFFGDDEMGGTLKPDKTFAGTYTLPDGPDGTYEVVAECPGTDYAVLSFRLINPEAPPAPVPGRPRFTG